MRKLVLAVLFLSLSQSLLAQHSHSGWIHSYTAETAGKKYVFVMRRNDGGDDYLVGDKYKWSGMYRNDGSTAPLWTVDWKQRVFLPDDGKHVVRFGSRRYSATYREEAFTFVSEGKSIKSYQVRDLIAFPYLLPHSSAGYGLLYSPLAPDLPNDGVLMKVDEHNYYPLNSGAIIDNEKQTLAFETCHGDKYLFDFTTGEMISGDRPSRNLSLWLFGFLLTGCAAYLFFAARLKVGETVSSIVSVFGGFLVTCGLFLIPIISILTYKTQCDYDLPDYPDFWTCCLVSVSMLPRYLLTSLNLIAPPEQDFPSVGFDAVVFWAVLFWFPAFTFFAFSTHSLIRFLKAKRRKFC